MTKTFDFSAEILVGRCVIAIFIEKSRSRRNSDERAHRVHECDYENRQHNGKESPREDAVQVKL